MNDSDYKYANLSKSGIHISGLDDCSFSSESEDNLDEESTTDWKQINTEQSNSPTRFETKPFIANPECTVLLSDNVDVLDYFRLFVDDLVLDLLVLETNRYAEQEAGSSSNQWQPVEKNEMMVFLTIIILQGLIKKPEERMYWSTNEIFSTPIFPKLMTQRRYLSIKRNLHFYNEDLDRESHPNPKLYKIWPIYEHINNKCSSLEIPERHIEIDKDGIRKRQKKYYKKMFFYLLDICIGNSYILYRKNGGQKNNLDFRTELIERLIESYYKKENGKRSVRSTTAGVLRLTERHFPSFIPPTAKKLGPTRYCAVCCAQRDSSGKRRRKESRYMCKSCNVGLCAAPCFEIYHTKDNF